MLSTRSCHFCFRSCTATSAHASFSCCDGVACDACFEVGRKYREGTGSAVVLRICFTPRNVRCGFKQHTRNICMCTLLVRKSVIHSMIFISKNSLFHFYKQLSGLHPSPHDSNQALFRAHSAVPRLLFDLSAQQPMAVLGARNRHDGARNFGN